MNELLMWYEKLCNAQGHSHTDSTCGSDVRETIMQSGSWSLLKHNVSLKKSISERAKPTCYASDELLQPSSSTLNTHYRHILGTWETWACNGFVFVTCESRCRRICQGPCDGCACIKGNSKFCFQTSSAMSLKKIHHEILSNLLIGVWILAMITYSLCRAI